MQFSYIIFSAQFRCCDLEVFNLLRLYFTAKEYLEDVTELKGEVTLDNLDENEMEPESENAVDNSGLMTTNDSNDEIKIAELVASVTMDEETPGLGDLKKSVISSSTTKTFASLMDRTREKEVPPASNYNIRFGFEDVELEDFINKICLDKDTELSSKSSVKGKNFSKLNNFCNN